MVRNQHGFIILDEAIEIENNLVNKGRKPKTWLLFENEEYLFKTNSSNYEIWSELLASELGKQCKIEMAEYDIGIYKGKYIDFEAKETAKNFFPLANIHEHQIKHLMNVYKHGAIAFIIVRFTKLNKTFLLTANDLKVFLENNSRKSIPFEYFKQHAYIIKDSFNPCTDYIKIVDKLISKEI